MKIFETKITRGDVETKLTVLAADKDEAEKRIFEILGVHGLKIKEM